MNANKRAPARFKATEEYLLTTKPFCGDCGRMMVGESGKGGGGRVYHYYKCSGAKRRLGCKRKALKKDMIEEAVVRITVSRVLTDRAIDRIADAVIAFQGKADTTTPVLQHQLSECERGIENLLNALQMGICTASTKKIGNPGTATGISETKYSASTNGTPQVHQISCCQLDQPI